MTQSEGLKMKCSEKIMVVIQNLIQIVQQQEVKINFPALSLLELLRLYHPQISQQLPQLLQLNQMGGKKQLNYNLKVQIEWI